MWYIISWLKLVEKPPWENVLWRSAPCDTWHAVKRDYDSHHHDHNSDSSATITGTSFEATILKVFLRTQNMFQPNFPTEWAISKEKYLGQNQSTLPNVVQSLQSTFRLFAIIVSSNVCCILKALALVPQAFTTVGISLFHDSCLVETLRSHPKGCRSTRIFLPGPHCKTIQA